MNNFRIPTFHKRIYRPYGMLRIMGYSYGGFGTNYRSHRQGSNSPLTLKDGTDILSRIFVSTLPV